VSHFRHKHIFTRHSPQIAQWALRGFAWLPVLWLAGCAATPSTLAPQGTDAKNVASLAWLMFAIALVVFAGVLVLLLIATLRKRRGLDHGIIINPPNERRTLTLVVLFGAVLPAVVLLVVMGLSVSLDNAEVSAQASSEPTIEVVGHQWWWEVRYPQQGIVTANEIHIPVGQPVAIKLTSADVIHSFWVPQLHGKIDMIPGQTNTMTLEADQAGNYRGECAEYCGTQHAKMDFLVVAEDKQAYDTWLAGQAQAAPSPAEGSVEKQGQQAFLGSSCTYCHTIRGTNASGQIGPDLTHIASRQTLGAGALPNTPGNLGGWITNAQAIKPGNLMPPMDLDPTQVQQILAYLETLK
jgi:cytochrome c oxidase subunit II